MNFSFEKTPDEIPGINTKVINGENLGKIINVSKSNTQSDQFDFIEEIKKVTLHDEDESRMFQTNDYRDLKPKIDDLIFQNMFDNNL